MITVTNNYFADLNAAIEAGIFSASDRRPKKPDLADAYRCNRAPGFLNWFVIEMRRCQDKAGLLGRAVPIVCQRRCDLSDRPVEP
ncbi:MAG: hypothetical protein HC895_08210 [Leptolyngbyaceae cyanobacterium SM1_3_5]|nr:hypothetical protein [Leptolyngbyaceae cyanobacterium SM1_3_5]